MEHHHSESALQVNDDTESMFAILGGSDRSGPWEPPGELRIIAVMGGVNLDFREADMLEGVSEVHIVACMGGVNIIVPPDIQVDMSGFGILGSFGTLRRTVDDYEAPTLRVRGFAAMGGVVIKVMEIGESDDD